MTKINPAAGDVDVVAGEEDGKPHPNMMMLIDQIALMVRSQILKLCIQPKMKQLLTCHLHLPLNSRKMTM